jgi:lipid II:glycine glycyltransferase (peptidoglycan interpeptide bridge formation enzyme)
LKLSDNLTLYLAYHDEELLGGFLLFHYSKKANNFLSAGSLSHKKYNINDYLQVVAIRGAVEKKCKWIHFGGGNSNDKNDSLLRFKSKFSKTCSDFYIGKKIHNQDVYDKVVGQWTDRYPEKTHLFNNHLLKYRY